MIRGKNRTFSRKEDKPQQLRLVFYRFTTRSLMFSSVVIAILLSVLFWGYKLWTTPSSKHTIQMSTEIALEDSTKTLWGFFCFGQDDRMTIAVLSVQEVDEYPIWFGFKGTSSSYGDKTSVYVDGKEVMPATDLVLVIVAINDGKATRLWVPYAEVERAGLGNSDLFELENFWDFVKKQLSEGFF